MHLERVHFGQQFFFGSVYVGEAPSVFFADPGALLCFF